MRLSEKYRPLDFNQIVGNEETVKTVQNLLSKSNHPQTYLITGSIGSGKTTIANIIADEVQAQIFNCSNDMNVEAIKNIEEMCRTWSDTPRVFIQDEAHRITDAAAERMKVLIENPPHNTYFLLITDRPEKLDKAIKSRCTVIQMQSLTEKQTMKLLRDICSWEEVEVPSSKLMEITEASDGCARDAVKLLETVIANPEAQINTDYNEEEQNPQAYDVAKILFSSKSTWATIREKLNACKANKVSAESVRCVCLAYGGSMLLKSDNKQAAKIMDNLRDDRTSTATGWPLLTLDIYCAIQ